MEDTVINTSEDIVATYTDKGMDPVNNSLKSSESGRRKAPQLTSTTGFSSVTQARLGFVNSSKYTVDISSNLKLETRRIKKIDKALNMVDLQAVRQFSSGA